MCHSVISFRTNQYTLLGQFSVFRIRAKSPTMSTGCHTASLGADKFLAYEGYRVSHAGVISWVPRDAICTEF